MTTPEPATDTDNVSSSAALRVLWRSVGRWIVLPIAGLALFAGSHTAFTPLFRSMCYKQGYLLGLAADISEEESEYYLATTSEGVRSAWSLSGVDYDEIGGPGWYVASFYVRSVDTTDILAEHQESPKILVPSLSIQSRAVTGRWYRLGSDGGITYVER